MEIFLYFFLYCYAEEAFFAIKEYATFISTHIYRCMHTILCVNIAEERKRLNEYIMLLNITETKPLKNV